MEYNGFKNKATWIVSLWLNNTESLATHWSNVARDVAKRHDFIDTVEIVADRLKAAYQSWVSDTLIPFEPMSGCLCDLLTHALEDVDWDHIAQNLLENVPFEG